MPLIAYSFVLLFEHTTRISKNITSFEIDEVSKEFTIIFRIPKIERNEFARDVDNINIFYLDEVDTEGNTAYSEVYVVETLIKKYRKYDYGSGEPVTMTIIGKYK